MRRIRVSGLVALSAMGLSLGLTACGGSTAASSSPTATPQSTGLYAQVASSDLAVGRNRFGFGIIDNNRPLSTGRPKVTFFLVRGTTATAMGSTTATFNHFARGLQDTGANSAALTLQGVYVSYPTFTRAGTWGAEIFLRYKGKLRMLQTQPFAVSAHSLAPAVGSPAPRSQNPTVAQMPATKLDSGRPPDDMHRLSIAGAIAQHKPLLVLFATAAFCQSRLCGPEIEIVQRLEQRYRNRVNFVHIEIYKDADPSKGYAPAVNQWKLRSEPWIFVVNRKGIVTAKFEGPTADSEIADAIRGVLA